MSLCEECKNNVTRTYLFEKKHKAITNSCTYPEVHGLVPVIECSHFEERPKDNSKNFDEAKQTANKGKLPRKQPKKKEETREDCFDPNSSRCLEADDCTNCPEYKP